MVDGDAEDVFSGGFRRRLGVRSTEGQEVFVVNHLDQKMAELRVLLPRLSD